MLSLVYLSCEIATQIHDSFLKAHVGQKFWEDTAETHKISLGIPERSVKALEVFWEIWVCYYSHCFLLTYKIFKNWRWEESFTWRYNQNYDSVICRPRIASLFFSAFSAATVTDIQWLILMMISAKLLYQWHGNYEKFGLKIQLKFRVKYSEILKHMIMFVWPILCYRLWEVVRFVRPAWPIGLSQAPQYQPCWEMSTIVLKEGFVFVLPLVIEL